MIHKQMGAIMLVAGTCIGSGMLALPLVLAQIGLLPSIVVMVLTWLLAYYTSLIHLELNLQAGTGMDLGQLAKRFSGTTAQLISSISLLVLSYSLLAVYIYGSASLLQTLIVTYLDTHCYLALIASGCALLAFLIFILPVPLIDYINRTLFIGLIGIATLLIGGLASTTHWSNIPWLSPYSFTFAAWHKVIPVLFTSFGFQVIFHTLTNYCNKNVVMLKRAFFWGSLIPALLYIIWTSTVLSTIYAYNVAFYNRMMSGSLEVGSLIKELSMITRWPLIQLLSWLISLLALFTSIVGVGMGLTDSVKSILNNKGITGTISQVMAAAITILPAYFIATMVPNAFITVLGFAGMILVLIAIAIPLYLLYTAHITRLYYPELRHRWLLLLCLAAGGIIMGCELFNICM